MSGAWIVLTCAFPLVASLALASPAAAQAPAPKNLVSGGLLYDTWWKAVPGVKEPAGDHPLWATQSTNKRKGTVTWRCKECHGWDYKGKDGAYGSGSHATGFPSVMGASARSVEAIKAILRGSTNPKHDFSSALGDAALADLALFLKHGVIDLAPVIDAKTKAPVKADIERGKKLTGAECEGCHGADGKTLNFGKPTAPEYVGTIAKGNPWEFQHKVRFGHPGADPAMPAGVEQGWSLQDVLDIMAWARTLPEK